MRNTIEIDAPPDAVWDVLADASAFGEWVVGTKGITRADAEWPAVGSALEYELGVGPITVGDRTAVVESVPPKKLVLRAELRSLGAASIVLELEPVGEATRVVMEEEPIEGLVAATHTRLSDIALKQRNEISLGRLKALAEAEG